LNLPLFLARRLRHAPIASFSATVTRIGIGSIALGLAVLLVSFAVLFGFKRTIQDKIFLFGAHLQVSKFTLNMSYDTPPLAVTSDLYRNAKQVPGVRHIQGVAMKAGILKSPNELAGAVLKGVGRDYDWTLLRETLKAGRIPNFSDSTYTTEMLVSQYMADQLQLKIGQRVPMYFLGGASGGNGQPRARQMTVSGIYETGLEEFDNQIVIGDLRLIQRLNNWGPDSVATYEIFVDDFTKIRQTASAVQARIQPDMRLVPVTTLYGPLFDWMSLLDTNANVLLGLILFVASFNMISVLLVLMLERTPMIGLLKALGSANGLLRRVFLFVGLNMVGWGLLLGNVIGLGLCFVQDRFRLIPLEPKTYFMSYVPIVWDWPTILLLNLGTVALIAAVLWLPTLIINRIRPVQALVFKK
jgi:lipoprotein-releasing system permease protein